MAKGVYFKCDFCGEEEHVELWEEAASERVYKEFKKLPKGWEEIKVSFYDYSEGGYWTSIMAQFCSVQCTILYLEDHKANQELAAKQFAEAMKEEEEADENAEEVG